MDTKKKRRMYGMLYRARRNGSKIVTKERTIYRSYAAADDTPIRQERVLMKEFNYVTQLFIE